MGALTQLPNISAIFTTAALHAGVGKLNFCSLNKIKHYVDTRLPSEVVLVTIPVPSGG